MRLTPRSLRFNRQQRLRQGFAIGAAVAVVLILLRAWLLIPNLNLTNFYFGSAAKSETIVIIAIDDQSLSAYGRSPLQWDRTLYADLLLKLNAGKARVVVFDLLFSESSSHDADFAQAIQTVRASDNRTRVILGMIGVGAFGIVPQADGTTAANFDNVLAPVDVLAEQADYVVFANAVPDPDNVFRRQFVWGSTQGETRLFFPVAAYLAWLRVPAAAVLQVVTPAEEGLNITGDRLLPVDANGVWLQNFFGEPGSTFPVYSMHDVLTDTIPPDAFEDKIVLVGLMNAEGAIDKYLVPTSSHGEQMAGVEINAHAIETLIRNAPLWVQPSLMQAVTIVIMAVVSSVVYVQVRWYWKLVLLAVFIGLFTVVALLNFSLRYEVIYPLHPILALVFPLLISIGWEATIEANLRQRSEFLLQSVVDLTNQQMATDLILKQIAADVQRILKVQQGAVWLRTNEGDITHVFPEQSESAIAALSGVYTRAHESGKQIIDGGKIAVPVRWQGRSIGVIAAQFQRVDDTAITLLDDLAQQIAPGLENAILYAETNRQKLLLEAIINGTATYIVILDGQFNILQANNIFASHMPESLGKSLLVTLRGAGLSENHETQLQRLFNRQQAFQQEIQLDQHSFNLYATLLPGYNLWVVVLSNVTALAELNRLKTHMIRMASHDLKNPLAGILGYSTLLIMDEDQFSEEQQRFVHHIHRTAETMLNIIEDILNLEQLRSTELPDETVLLARLVYDVISRHEPEMTMKRQQFKMDIQRDLPPLIGRPTQLSQVITNLLGNAIKYTPDEGQITLRLYLIQPDTLRLEVQDTGYGIAQESQQKLFTEFYRVKSPQTAHITGTGLGLSLVKSVVEAHQGRVWVESEVGQGSTFYVEFPATVETVTND